jgi:hypothetical protein
LWGWRGKGKKLQEQTDLESGAKETLEEAWRRIEGGGDRHHASHGHIAKDAMEAAKLTHTVPICSTLDNCVPIMACHYANTKI